jgi:hypothetical protein
MGAGKIILKKFMCKKVMLMFMLIAFMNLRCTQTTILLKSPHFNFVFKADIAPANSKKLISLLEGNYDKIGAFLETKPDSPIKVNIYSSRWQYAMATGNWTASGSIEGTGKLHFMQEAWDETDIGKIAIHEFTHTVTLKLLIEQEAKPLDKQKFDTKFKTFPTWLWESISVYAAGQFVDPKTLPFMTNRGYPGIDELNNRSQGQKIYKVGYVLIEYILHQYGHEKFIALIKSYGNIPATLNVSQDVFMKDWDDFVKKKYLQR